MQQSYVRCQVAFRIHVNLNAEQLWRPLLLAFPSSPLSTTTPLSSAPIWNKVEVFNTRHCSHFSLDDANDSFVDGFNALQYNLGALLTTPRI